MTERDAIEQLADLLDGTAGPSDVTSELGALLTLADTLRDTTVLAAPSDEFRAALRAEVVAAASAPAPLTDRLRAAWLARTAALRTSARVAIATATASGMIGSAGVAAAAQEALPGEVLYPVKTATEQVRLLLATDDLAEARLHLQFAAERLEELRATAGELSEDEIVALLERMDESARLGAEALLDGAAAGAADLDELRDFVTVQERELSSLYGDLPLLAQPAAKDSLELLRRISVNATGVIPSGTTDRVDVSCECEDVLSPTGTVLSGPVRGGDVTILLPGEGPAVPLPDCDCVTLPGGEDAREPDTSGGDTEDDGAAPEQQDEEREPPFRGEGPLSGGEFENEDEDEDEGTVGEGTSTAPVEDVADTAEDSTGVVVDTGPVERGAETVDDLLD